MFPPNNKAITEVNTVNRKVNTWVHILPAYKKHQHTTVQIFYAATKNNFEVRHPRCVLNHNVENKCEKTVINTTILYLYS
jgi:hypothetical protein